MAININSEAFCRKAYLNYHCYGNTMGLSAADMGRITQAWEDRLPSWKATVADDENEYEFDDSEYNNYKEQGENLGKEATGEYEREIGEDWVSGVSNGLGAGIGALVAYAGENFFTKGLGKACNTFGESAIKTLGGENLAKNNAKKSGEKALKNSGSWSIAAPLALALAIVYKISKPNKEAKEACDALQSEMTDAQLILTDTQEEMSSISNEIINLSDEATTTNEDTNEEIEKQKTEYDMYMATFLAIEEKIKAGKTLTNSEKDLYEEVVEYMVEIGDIINKLSTETSDEVDNIYDDIASYQENYDISAETMGQVQGVTDYAASFDEASRTLCYVEIFSQTLNAASGIEAAVKATAAAIASAGFNTWAWACAAMGGTAGVLSGLAIKEQTDFLGVISSEIGYREVAQGTNEATMEMYTEEIDAYDGYMQGIEDLELEIPDDIEAPEDTALPEDTKPQTPQEAVPDILKPKEEEEEENS